MSLCFARKFGCRCVFACFTYAEFGCRCVLLDLALLPNYRLLGLKLNQSVMSQLLANLAMLNARFESAEAMIIAGIL